MYGWLCGIIFSKLAFSVSRVVATYASTSVTSAQTITIASRLLNTSRSSQLPELGSKSARSRTTGICSVSIVTPAMSIVLASVRGVSAN